MYISNNTNVSGRNSSTAHQRISIRYIRCLQSNKHSTPCIMHLLNTFAVATALAIALAAPASLPQAESGLAATTLDSFPNSDTPVQDSRAPTHNLAALSGWASICKDSDVGEQICFAVVCDELRDQLIRSLIRLSQQCSQLYGINGKCKGSWFGLDKICVCS